MSQQAVTAEPGSVIVTDDGIGTCGEHLLLPGEQVLAQSETQTCCCICIPIGTHILSLTNKRILGQKKYFYTPGASLATASLEHVSAAHMSRGHPPVCCICCGLRVYCYIILILYAIFLFIFQVQNTDTFIGYWILFLIAGIVLSFLRSRAIEFKVDGDQSNYDDMFVSIDDLSTLCTDAVNDTKRNLLRKYAQSKESNQALYKMHIV